MTVNRMLRGFGFAACCALCHPYVWSNGIHPTLSTVSASNLRAACCHCNNRAFSVFRAALVSRIWASSRTWSMALETVATGRESASSTGAVESISAIRVSSKIFGSVRPIINRPTAVPNSNKNVNRCARLRIGAATRTTDPGFSFTSALGLSQLMSNNFRRLRAGY